MRDTAKNPQFAKMVGKALVRAGAAARRTAMRFGTPIYVWENGKVVAKRPWAALEDLNKMFELPRFRNAYLFQKPINIRWGEKKLTELCKQHIGIEPRAGDAFLFFNAKRDALKLFFLDSLGSNDIQKRLPRGGFMLPAPSVGEDFVKIGPTLVQKLFGR